MSEGSIDRRPRQSILEQCSNKQAKGGKPNCVIDNEKKETIGTSRDANTIESIKRPFDKARSTGKQEKQATEVLALKPPFFSHAPILPFQPLF